MNSVYDYQAEISDLLKRLFDVARRRKQLKNEYDQRLGALKAIYERDDKVYAQQLKEAKSALYELVTENKSKLLTGTLKSFAMLYGKVAFKQKRKTFKVTDKSAVEKLARKDRILTSVGQFERVWKPDAKKLEQWLERNPDKAAQYEAFVERDGGYDEIFAQPNDAYLTKFDPNRLSNESIKLEAPDESKDI